MKNFMVSWVTIRVQSFGWQWRQITSDTIY